MRWDRCIFHGSFNHASIGVCKSSWLTILNIQKPYSAFLFLGPLVELFLCCHVGQSREVYWWISYQEWVSNCEGYLILTKMKLIQQQLSNSHGDLNQQWRMYRQRVNWFGFSPWWKQGTETPPAMTSSNCRRCHESGVLWRVLQMDYFLGHTGLRYLRLPINHNWWSWLKLSSKAGVWCVRDWNHSKVTRKKTRFEVGWIMT